MSNEPPPEQKIPNSQPQQASNLQPQQQVPNLQVQPQQRAPFPQGQQVASNPQGQQQAPYPFIPQQQGPRPNFPQQQAPRPLLQQQAPNQQPQQQAFRPQPQQQAPYLQPQQQAPYLQPQQQAFRPQLQQQVPYLQPQQQAPYLQPQQQAPYLQPEQQAPILPPQQQPFRPQLQPQVPRPQLQQQGPRPQFQQQGPRPQLPQGPLPQLQPQGPRPQLPQGPLPQLQPQGPRTKLPQGPLPQLQPQGPRPQLPQGPLPQLQPQGPRTQLPQGPLPQLQPQGPRPQLPQGPLPQLQPQGPRTQLPQGPIPQLQQQGPRPQLLQQGPRPQLQGPRPQLQGPSAQQQQLSSPQQQQQASSQKQQEYVSGRKLGQKTPRPNAKQPTRKLSLWKDSRGKPPIDHDYDPYQHRYIRNGITGWQAAAHIFKCALGASILAMPQCFSKVGLISAIIWNVVLTAIVTHCIMMAVKSSYLQCKRVRMPGLPYYDAVRIAIEYGPEGLRKFGKCFGIFLAGALFLLHIGICCYYISYIATAIKRMVDPVKELPVQVHMVIIAAPMMIFNSIPNLKILAPFSVIGTFLIVCALSIVIYFMLNEPNPDNSELLMVGEFSEVPLYLGTALSTLTPIGTAKASITFCSCNFSGSSFPLSRTQLRIHAVTMAVKIGRSEVQAQTALKEDTTTEPSPNQRVLVHKDAQTHWNVPNHDVVSATTPNCLALLPSCVCADVRVKILTIEYNMKEPKKFRGVFGIYSCVIMSNVVLTLIFGGIGYNFCRQDCEYSVEKNIPQQVWLADTISWLFIFGLTVSYSLQAYVPAGIILHIWKRRRPDISEQKMKKMNYLVRAIVYIITWALSLVVPKLGLYVSLFAALCMPFAGIVVPAIMDTLDAESVFVFLKDILIFFLGLVIIISATSNAIYDLIRQ